MGKNVAVFVDVANIFYAAKAAGVDIDYVTLLKAATAGRDFVRAYAYTGLDPENENQRNFHSFLARHGYKVVSKDIRKYGDGKVKANLDIELVVDMMKTARNLDVAIVVSGDGDFAPAIRAVQEMGVRVEVISFRGNTSSDLIEVADIFTDITQLAKVDRGSSRSGRRVAEEEFDMAGTDIPDKQTEGTGSRDRRGRGRRRGFDEAPSRGREGFARETREAREAAVGREDAVGAPRDVREGDGREVAAAAGGRFTVLPGERLSRVAATPTPDIEPELEELTDEEELLEPITADGAVDGETGEPRRRRRRGGRGRGRGRGRADEGLEGEAPVAAEGVEAAAPADRAERIERPERVARPERPERRERPPLEFEDEEPVAPRGPRPTPFGSIWDSQLGVPAAPTSGLGPLIEDDEEEPEIPEYLLAERRRGPQGQGQGGRGQGGGRGGRGVRAGYSAAIDRERYGRGGLNRYGEPQRPSQPSGNRPQQPAPRREERAPQPPMRSERPARSAEWSEVPPEIEEMLRAQMAARGGPRPADRSEGRGGAPRGDQAPRGGALRQATDQPAERAGASEAASAAADVPGAEAAVTPARRRGRPPKAAAERTGSVAAPTAATQSEAPATGEASATAEATAPARRGRPRRAAADTAPASTGGVEGTAAPSSADQPTAEATPASTGARRGRPRKTDEAAAATATAPTAPAAAEPEATPARRRGRPPKAAADPGTAPGGATEASSGEAPAAPARRRGRTAAPAADTAPAAESDAAARAPARRRSTRGATTSS